MRLVRVIYAIAYAAIVLCFGACAVGLIGLSAWQLYRAASGSGGKSMFAALMEAIGLLTVAVAALELSQTILEEEIRRDVQPSGPSRARRFLSRFVVVVVVALAVETLVGVFQVLHEDVSRLPHVAWIGFAAAALLAAWGVFVALNRRVEKLEPEHLEQVKAEDREVDSARDTHH